MEFKWDFCESFARTHGAMRSLDSGSFLSPQKKKIENHGESTGRDSPFIIIYLILFVKKITDQKLAYDSVNSIAPGDLDAPK